MCKATKTGYGLFKVGATTSDAHKDEPSTAPMTAIKVDGNGRLVLVGTAYPSATVQHIALRFGLLRNRLLLHGFLLLVGLIHTEAGRY